MTFFMGANRGETGAKTGENGQWRILINNIIGDKIYYKVLTEGEIYGIFRIPFYFFPYFMVLQGGLGALVSGLFCFWA